jgi:hypothetical protein
VSHERSNPSLEQLRKKGEDVLNKLLYAAAVLALLTGPMAVAQSGGAVGASVGGTFDRSVNGQVDRSVNASIGGKGGGRTQSHPSASSWAPSRNAAMAEQAAAYKAGATPRTEENEEASNSKAENPSETKKATPKPGTIKTFGATAAPTSASSFGMGFKSGGNQLAFSSKMKLTGSSHRTDRERTKEESFEKKVAGHRTPGTTHKRRRGREFMPKLSPLPHGESGCKDASSLQLCTWL